MKKWESEIEEVEKQVNRLKKKLKSCKKCGGTNIFLNNCYAYCLNCDKDMESTGVWFSDIACVDKLPSDLSYGEQVGKVFDEWNDQNGMSNREYKNRQEILGV